MRNPVRMRNPYLEIRRDLMKDLEAGKGRPLAFLGLCLCVGLVSSFPGDCEAFPAANPPAEPVRIVRVPEGGVQPEVAVEANGTVHMVFLTGDPAGCDVYYCRRLPAERNFSTAIRVNSEPHSAIAIGTVRGAQVAVGRNGRVHVAWNGSQRAREPGAKGAPMLYSRQAEDGKNFEPQRNLMTSTMNLDGGGSVAADPLGNVYVVWHAHPQGGEEGEVYRHVYVAGSADDGKTFTPERPVVAGKNGTCGCCGLKSFADQEGRLAIAYRSADAVGNRDMTLLLSSDQAKTFQSKVLGPWRVTTCPMSTQDLGAAPDGGLLAMWETRGQVFRETVLPDQLSRAASALAAENEATNRKHPRFAFSRDQQRLLLAWVEDTGWEKGGSLAWECINIKTRATSSGRKDGVPAWDFAAVIAEPDGGFAIIY